MISGSWLETSKVLLLLLRINLKPVLPTTELVSISINMSGRAGFHFAYILTK